LIFDREMTDRRLARHAARADRHHGSVDLVLREARVCMERPLADPKWIAKINARS